MLILSLAVAGCAETLPESGETQEGGAEEVVVPAEGGAEVPVGEEVTTSELEGVTEVEGVDTEIKVEGEEAAVEAVEEGGAEAGAAEAEGEAPEETEAGETD